MSQYYGVKGVTLRSDFCYVWRAIYTAREKTESTVAGVKAAPIVERYAISESVECDNENTADKDSDITRPSVPSTDKGSHPDSGRFTP